MSVDPRDIIKAAGVECAEAGVYRLAADRWEVDPHDNGDESVNAADAAILALYKLVARYKWQRDEACRLRAEIWCSEYGRTKGLILASSRGHDAAVAAYWEDDLDRRWEEHDAAR